MTASGQQPKFPGLAFVSDMGPRADMKTDKATMIITLQPIPLMNREYSTQQGICCHVFKLSFRQNRPGLADGFEVYSPSSAARMRLTRA